MSARVTGILLVLLLLFQCLESKKKKQTAPEPTTFLEDVGDFLGDAWGALTDLVGPVQRKSSNKKKKKKTTNTWNSYVKSATSTLNDMYHSVSDSLPPLARSKDDDMEHAFFAELFTAEVLENVTWGLMDIASRLDNRD